MTGRLLLSRKGYPINHEAIIKACAANDVVIELNAHPRRLDMDWRYIHQAMQEDVLISINDRLLLAVLINPNSSYIV